MLGRLADLGRGALALSLPDGSRHRFAGPDPGPEAEFRVHRWRTLARLLLEGDIGLGEGYTAGDWTTPDLVALTRLLIANERDLGDPSGAGWLARLGDRLLHLARTNTRRRARANIRAHYDLSNDFYRLFLDETMTYSAAVFEPAGLTLAEAQRAKYRRLAAGVGLQRGQHVLEIGCGWGGFAVWAATELGCRVTGVTLSEAQAEVARQRVREAGLEDRVEIRIVDYRDVDGRYDAIVSIEMLEAVGHAFLGDFFRACDRLLTPGGRVALQVITIPDQLYDGYRRGVDWIRKHIFPGGHLPSLGALQQAMAHNSGFVVHSLDDVALHYAETLRRWRRAFGEHLEAVAALGFDDAFQRTWDFYLGVCEACFASRKLGTLQLVLTRPGLSAWPAGPYCSGAA